MLGRETTLQDQLVSILGVLNLISCDLKLCLATSHTHKAYTLVPTLVSACLESTTSTGAAGVILYAYGHESRVGDVYRLKHEGMFKTYIHT